MCAILYPWRQRQARTFRQQAVSMDSSNWTITRSSDLSSFRTNMLCSTASSKFVCSCISVIKHTKVKALTSDNCSTTVSKRAFLDLNEKGKCWPLLFFARYALFNCVNSGLWAMNCWLLCLNVSTTSKTGPFSRKISQNAFGSFLVTSWEVSSLSRSHFGCF